MPSFRRVKAVTILIFLAVITLLFYTASLRQRNDPQALNDFYSKTKSALAKGLDGTDHSSQFKKQGGEDAAVAKEMNRRLKEAAQVAKSNANAKAPKPDAPSDVIGKGSSAEGSGERGVAGRRKFGGKATQEVVKEEEKEETQEEHDVEVALNGILKKSPIIIFSKSYCPHSARAKNILLNSYIIDPPPFVVELDQHPLGAQLQEKLRQKTGRRTVPNVLINAVSIGGGDDIAELDAKRELADKILELGGKKMNYARQRPAEEKKKKEEDSHGLR